MYRKILTGIVAVALLGAGPASAASLSYFMDRSDHVSDKVFKTGKIDFKAQTFGDDYGSRFGRLGERSRWRDYDFDDNRFDFRSGRCDDCLGDGAIGRLLFDLLDSRDKRMRLGFLNRFPLLGSYENWMQVKRKIYDHFHDKHKDVVPIPASLWLMSSGLGFLGWMRYRRRELES